MLPLKNYVANLRGKSDRPTQHLIAFVALVVTVALSVLPSLQTVRK
jgi:hypothetical protein